MANELQKQSCKQKQNKNKTNNNSVNNGRQRQIIYGGNKYIEKKKIK